MSSGNLLVPLPVASLLPAQSVFFPAPTQARLSEVINLHELITLEHRRAPSVLRITPIVNTSEEGQMLPLRLPWLSQADGGADMLSAQVPTSSLRSPSAPSWSPFARSAPLPRVLRSTVGRGAPVLGLPSGSQPPARERVKGEGGRGAGGQMEPPRTLQRRMQPSGEHFTEERTLQEPGVPSAGCGGAGSLTERHELWHR